jgi:hydrogenase maturation protease
VALTASPSSPDPKGGPGHSKRLLIGLGNLDRGDDGAGRAVARRLLRDEHLDLDVLECAGEATGLMEAWAGHDDVVLVDACRGAGPPGRIHRIAPDEAARVATLRHASTHSLGVAAAIGLARALGTLPRRLAIYAIEASHAREGIGLSPEVERAVEEVAAAVRRDAEP